MPEIKESFDIKDGFSQALDRMADILDKCAGIAEKLDKNLDNAGGRANKLHDSSKEASKGLGFGGMGGSMLILNQAMQAFTRIAEPVKQAMDDIASKQRALIIFGHDAGIEFNQFARDIAMETGRAEGEIRKMGMKWRNIGVGGNNIKELTKLADRFSNLNPGREFTDVADVFAEAIKSKSTSGLADLLGGGEGVELKLQRGGVERMLRHGNVSGAMDKFKEIADSFGYTQQKADEMGMTIDRKIQKIATIGKNYVIDAFSDVVQMVEPYVDKVLDWLQSPEFHDFFDDLKTNLGIAAAAVIALSDTIVEGWSNIYDVLQPFVDRIMSFVNETLPYAADESLSFVDKLIVLFVGGTTQIVTSIIAGIQVLWNTIVDTTQDRINFVLDIIERGVNWVLDTIRKARVWLVDIIDGLVNDVIDLLGMLAETNIGDLMGINSAIDGLKQVSENLKEVKNEKAQPFKIERKDFSDKRVNVIDSVQMSADMIEAALNKVHGIYDKSSQNQKKFNEYLKDALGGINDDTHKLAGLAQKEQDLRWMKEMAEQKFVNEINLRQLTPTINLQVKGSSNQTPNEYAKSLAIELQRMADAGTFNAYGNVG